MLNPSLKDLDPSSEELKEVAKLLAQKRGIKDYKSMSEDKLLSALILSKPVKKSEKSKINFSTPRIEKIRKELKGCVRYIFACLFCLSKREHLWNKGKCFLFHFESSFRSWDNQILTF